MSKVVEDVTAASSTVQTTETISSEPSTAERIAKLSGEALTKYELTGELPEIEKPAAASSTEAVPEPAPASEPVKEQEPKPIEPRTWRQQRKIGELSAENRRLRRELETLRADKSKAVTAPASQETVTEADEPIPPNIEDFNTLAEFNAANSKYNRELVKSELERDRRVRELAETQQDAEAAYLEDKESFQQREQEHRKGNTAYDQAFKTVSEALDKVFAESPDRYVERFIIRSGYGPAIIEHLYANVDTFKRLTGLPKDDALALLGKIEDRVETAIKKAPKPNTVTKAGEPPVNLSGTNEAAEGPPVGSIAWFDAENLADAIRILGTK